MAVTINIDKIVRDRLGTKGRYVPRWLTACLARLIHEEWDNVFLQRVGDKTGTAWLTDCLDYLGATLDVYGADNLPAADDGKRYTFVANHPLGGMDGVAIGAIIGQKYGDHFRYLVNDLLMNLPGLATLCVPINKTGKNARSFPEVVAATFAADAHVLMFPAGLCSRRQRGVIRDVPWTKTFLTKSIATGRDIVPIYFEGQNSDRFYTVANLCQRLHITLPLAMLLLPDELYRNCNKTFRVAIGAPIPVATFDNSRRASDWAQWVYDRCYTLASTLPPQ